MTRRERLRAETAAEIKSVALKLMYEGGPGAISLRAIAREMGMTAGAIYGYFDTRDDLITALIADLYNAFADTLDAARAAEPEDDPAARIIAHGLAFRRWAIDYPAEFRLVYGDPLPDYQPPEQSPAIEAEQRLCKGVADMVAAAWPRAAAMYAKDDFSWDDFTSVLAGLIREWHPELPPAGVALCLRVWGRLHGLVALEVYGHLRPHVTDPTKHYLAELHDLVRSLGL
ncbi:TetR/AcrR family transcriptional regulator [Nonomuraea sp. NPDC049152]|uniref:TetR/AcrR family transcriptional regulator n=1 Tax=Nonomuraea sp. NPDC049152 TaxID=3154350 RepID=UPI0033D7CFA6